MKKFYTAQDVELAYMRGETVIAVKPGDVITQVAREEADRKGVRFEEGALAPARNYVPEPAVPAYRPPAASPSYSGKSVIKVPYKGLISEQEVDKWREEFPILKNVIHVGNCSQSAQSKRVRAAINSYLDNWLTVGMDWEGWVDEINRAKAEFAKVINASPEEIAVSSSVSEAVSSIASSLDYSGARNKIVTTDIEFPTVNYIWLAHQKYGAKVDIIAENDNHEIDISEYERYIDDKTLLTSITQVYFLNGFKQDIKAISDLAHRKGSLALIDAYQCLGTEPVDVKAMNIDILTSGNLKYLFGIPGIAFMYVRKELTSMLKPALTGWFGQENPFYFHHRYVDYSNTASRFDTGTQPVLNAYAARAGLEIINEVGVERIKDRIDYLSGYALEACLQRNLNVISPLDVRKKGGTTAIDVSDRTDSHYVETELKRRNIIASARGDVIRVAPHFYTKAEDLDIVFDAIADILK